MRLGDVLERLKRKAIGRPDRFPRRVLTALLVLAITVSLGGVWLAMRSGIETGTSSLTYLRPVLQLMTSTWAYVAVLAWLVRRILLKRDEQYAEQAANITGYEPRSVRRLAYEAKSSDGSTRVIATTDDEPEEIQERVLNALETGEDDTMSLNPDAFSTAEDDLLEAGEPIGMYEERYEKLLAVYRSLQERAAELQAELDGGVDHLLGAELDPEKVAEAIKSGEDRHAPADLLGDEDQELADDLDAKIQELEQNQELREEILDELGAIEARLDAHVTAVDAEEAAPTGRLAHVRSLLGRAGRKALPAAKVAGATALAALAYHVTLSVAGFVPLDVVPTSVAEAAHDWRAYLIVSLLAGSATAALIRRGADDVEDEPSAEEPHDELGDPWREQYKLFRLDLASTLDFGELIWRFAVPAAVTVAALLVVVQFWIKPWLYPPIFAAGLLVGLLNYLRVSWTRSRRLSALREERETVNWSDVAILVKEVNVPEARIQYAWMGDRRYAHDDREEFAEEIALRAYELVNGVEVSPSIMEKEATQLDRMQPDLHGFRDGEKERIMTWLLDRVEAAQHGLVPKAKLIEDCVEHDVEPRRFGPGKRGKGYDPELVRAAYRELIPAALVEQEIALDEDGEETLTAVRHRVDPLPPEYGQIRAQFSSQFGNYARWDPMYELPDVSDRLDAEPVYASTLGYRGT